MRQHTTTIQNGKAWKLALLVCVSIAFHSPLSTLHSLWAQKPGTTPVTISHETQVVHGRKYYVHIVERGQTVYSIAKAYKVESFDAVTHVDIHFLHAGDTVWLPCRGQFSAAAEELEQQKKPAATTTASTAKTKTATQRPVPSTQTPATKSHSKTQGRGEQSQSPSQPPTVRKVGNTIKVALMMPLYLDQIDEISTSKFDIEQRGKKSYRQFEFIEFYEGLLLALDRLAERGISIELNVVDVSGNSPDAVRRAFVSPTSSWRYCCAMPSAPQRRWPATQACISSTPCPLAAKSAPTTPSW